MRLWKRNPTAIIVALLVVCAVIVCIPAVRNLFYPVRKPGVRGNMYTVQLAMQDFSNMTGGHYPVDINTTVEEVAGISSDSSNGLFSISGAKGSDPVSEKDIGSTGPMLLPKNFRNWRNPAGPALATSSLDPPVWSGELRGMVFYVPLDTERKVARRYKIYGAGRYRLLGLVLSSED